MNNVMKVVYIAMMLVPKGEKPKDTFFSMKYENSINEATNFIQIYKVKNDR